MMNTATFQFFQTGGYDDTIAAATSKFESERPGTLVTHVEFVAAYPGDRDGRWVDLEVTYST